MKNAFLRRIVMSLGVVTAIALSSCAYDPYYTSTSASYGYGHGYGGSSFTTTYFISTGNPRWGYDPRVNCYYDYHRRAYYDPYLYGYYPVGYRPPLIVGAPYPHGWRPGRAYCPPPSRVTNITLVNYRNRESAYRNLNHSWARDVRPSHGGRNQWDRGGNQWNRGGDNRQSQQPSTRPGGWGGSTQPATRPGNWDRGGNQQPSTRPGGWGGNTQPDRRGGQWQRGGNSGAGQPQEMNRGGRRPGLPPGYNAPVDFRQNNDSTPPRGGRQGFNPGRTQPEPTTRPMPTREFRPDSRGQGGGNRDSGGWRGQGGGGNSSSQEEGAGGRGSRDGRSRGR